MSEPVKRRIMADVHVEVTVETTTSGAVDFQTDLTYMLSRGVYSNAWITYDYIAEVA